MFSGDLLLVSRSEHEQPGTWVERGQIFARTRWCHADSAGNGTEVQRNSCTCKQLLLSGAGEPEQRCFLLPARAMPAGDGCPGGDKGEQAAGFRVSFQLLSDSHCLPR